MYELWTHEKHDLEILLMIDLGFQKNWYQIMGGKRDAWNR